MNNRIQQRFDRSIKDATEEAKAVTERERSANRRDLTAVVKAMPTDTAKPKGRLYLDKETQATMWDPAG
jgi:hypothetical protein